MRAAVCLDKSEDSSPFYLIGTGGGIFREIGGGVLQRRAFCAQRGLLRRIRAGALAQLARQQLELAARNRGLDQNHHAARRIAVGGLEALRICADGIDEGGIKFIEAESDPVFCAAVGQKRDREFIRVERAIGVERAALHRRIRRVRKIGNRDLQLAGLGLFAVCRHEEAIEAVRIV